MARLLADEACWFAVPEVADLPKIQLEFQRRFQIKDYSLPHRKVTRYLLLLFQWLLEERISNPQLAIDIFLRNPSAGDDPKTPSLDSIFEVVCKGFLTA